MESCSHLAKLFSSGRHEPAPSILGRALGKPRNVIQVGMARTMRFPQGFHGIQRYLAFRRFRGLPSNQPCGIIRNWHIVGLKRVSTLVTSSKIMGSRHGG